MHCFILCVPRNPRKWSGETRRRGKWPRASSSEAGAEKRVALCGHLGSGGWVCPAGRHATSSWDSPPWVRLQVKGQQCSSPWHCLCTLLLLFCCCCCLFLCVFLGFFWEGGLEMLKVLLNLPWKPFSFQKPFLQSHCPDTYDSVCVCVCGCMHVCVCVCVHA